MQCRKQYEKKHWKKKIAKTHVGKIEVEWYGWIHRLETLLKLCVVHMFRYVPACGFIIETLIAIAVINQLNVQSVFNYKLWNDLVINRNRILSCVVQVVPCESSWFFRLLFQTRRPKNRLLSKDAQVTTANGKWKNLKYNAHFIYCQAHGALVKLFLKIIEDLFIRMISALVITVLPASTGSKRTALIWMWRTNLKMTAGWALRLRRCRSLTDLH